MDTRDRNTILDIQLLKKQQILKSVYQLKIIATAIVILTIFIAYFRSDSSTRVFISLFAFLVVQVFATREYAELAVISKRIRLIIGGSYFPRKDVSVPWKVGAGVAIRDSYFLLLIFFDVSWLAHAYLYPQPAESYKQFLSQLSIGPVSGLSFIWFTILLWAFYTYLLVVGIIYYDEISYPEAINSNASVNGNPGINLKETWIKVRTFENDDFYLQGHHIHNPGKQPLILFPGFFQNGYVYDLSADVSLARFLWKNDFDIWIIHPRATSQSGARRKATSIDDLASDDIPAVINYVYSKTGIKPVFIGHSQGGISAIISMMGAFKLNDATVILSDEKRNERQNNLKGLVTMGSFLDFSFSRKSWLESFVKEGILIKIFGKKIRLIRSQALINVIKKINYLGTPFAFNLRRDLLLNRRLKLFLFPLTLVLNFISMLKLWEFLYHIPNVNKAVRIKLFYKTMDGTFSFILQQFYSAISNNDMRSVNGRVSYSKNYQRITLPVSIVAMELDTLADPVMMKQKMVDSFSSDQKFFTVWKGVGHEDHFTDPKYFPQVLSAIKNIC